MGGGLGQDIHSSDLLPPPDSKKLLPPPRLVQFVLHGLEQVVVVVVHVEVHVEVQLLPQVLGHFCGGHGVLVEGGQGVLVEQVLGQLPHVPLLLQSESVGGGVVGLPDGQGILLAYSRGTLV